MLKGQHLHYYKEEEDLKPQVGRILDVDASLCCWGDGKANGGKGLEPLKCIDTGRHRLPSLALQKRRPMQFSRARKRIEGP